MRGLHIIDTLWLGGAQAVERDYFENQPNNKDIFLYVLRKSNPKIDIKHPNVFAENSFSRYSFSPIFSISRLIKENKIDIIHCHLLRSHLFGYLLKRWFHPNIKLIIHEHSDIIDNERLSIPILKFIRKRASLFITCSNALRRDLVQKITIVDEKTVTLYNGINLEKFDRNTTIFNVAEEKKKLSIPEDAFVVGFIGRLTQRKGWQEFIETANLLKDNSSIRFVIAGDGEDKEKLLSLISSYKLDNVIYLGYVSNPGWFYSLIDCLVIPSHYEPMGITAIEAQAMGVPVIASNVTGLNEIITNENAILVEPKNVQELKKAINRAKDDLALCRHLSDSGLRNAKNYSIGNYVQELDSIYNSISSSQ